MKRLVVLVIIFAAMAMLGIGCGASVTVQNIIDVPDSDTVTAGSDTPSAALLSGFGVTRGGDRYKIVQSLGGTMGKPVQQSEEGIYNIKLDVKKPSSEDDL